MIRQSIHATYDSRETGPEYHVTVRLGDRTVKFQQPIPDPFTNTTVTIARRNLLGCLLRFRRLTVTVIVGGAPDRVNDVLELDDNTLIPNSTRRAAFDSHIHERLAGMT